MKNLFLPTEANNYQPRLLSKLALYCYLVLILVVNVGLSLLVPKSVKADVNIGTIYQLQNEERSNRGLSGLTMNSLLIESATQKAKAMLKSDCWSHYCPDGKSPWDFFDTAGYDYVYAGENLAEGFVDTNKLFQAWMNSPTHRANIINENFTEVGIGYATGKYQNIENNTIVVVHFGSTNKKTTTLPATGGETDPNLVKFTYPTTGGVINDTRPLFQGTTVNNSIVTIKLNGNALSKISAKSTNFSYHLPTPLTDGKHLLYAEISDSNGRFLGSSRNVEFTVDTTIPVINLNQVRVYSLQLKGDSTLVNVTIDNPDIYKLTESQTNITVIHSDDKTSYMSFDKDDLMKMTNLNITVYDRAGNKAYIEVPTSKLLAEAKEKQITQTAIKTEGIDNLSLKTKINWGFVAFLTTLFGIDFAYLSKTGFTDFKNRSKSHLHFGVYVILLIVLLIGFNSGSILTGFTR